MLPCPFCGGEPRLCTSLTDLGPQEWVICTVCGARAESVEKWNARVEGEKHA